VDPDTVTRPCTAANMVIEMLAASEAALILEVRELAADLEAYRELDQVAIEEVARLVRLVETQSRTIGNLRDELRRYTAAAVLGRAA
jgi:hypothetical protein